LGEKLELAMEFIPGGAFLMGSPEDEKERLEGETQHEVTVAPFFMGKYPVMQDQWFFVASLPKVDVDLPPDPSFSKRFRRPVEPVKWHEAVEFCKRLSSLTGRNYSLPSEAQWEYACRARTTTAFSVGETITRDSASFGVVRDETLFSRTTEAGIFPPNAFGLCDMHGNVWEWCQDSWHESYEGAPQDDSAWVTSGEPEKKVIRGGAWNSAVSTCRSASRRFGHANKSYVTLSIGFRVVREADIPSPG
jgi:formylglycine-generating enzyme required for sulfatase activity